MPIKPLEALISNPIAFAQSVVEDKQVTSVEGSKANLAKDKVDGEAKIAQTLIESAADYGRKLLARA